MKEADRKKPIQGAKDEEESRTVVRMEFNKPCQYSPVAFMLVTAQSILYGDDLPDGGRVTSKLILDAVRFRISRWLVSYQSSLLSFLNMDVAWRPWVHCQRPREMFPR